MGIQVIHTTPREGLASVMDLNKVVPNTIVLCDYVLGCDRALEFKGQGDTAGIIRHIINANPSGWVADRAKFFCGEHSTRVDKKKLRRQIRD